MLKPVGFIFICCFLCGQVLAQQITFRKFINPEVSIADFKCFDGKQTSDGGYILTGLGTFAGNVTRPSIAKFNCKGQLIWAKAFGNSGSWSNIFNKVIETTDSNYVMLNNTGTFNAYNILIVKLDAKGNTVWKKNINASLGNDMGQNIKQTKDGGYIICGSTTSYGTGVGSGGTNTDAYIIKLDASATVQWSKTIGNATKIDDAKDIIEDIDGDFVFTGSYIHQDCFQILFGKLDQAGNLKSVHTYGDTLSRNGGYCITQLANKDYIIFGNTTLHNPSPSFSADISHALLRVNNNGDKVYSKVFNGNNNSSDNSLSMCLDASQNIILGTETMSFPSTGFTPNKQVAYKFDANGNLLKTIGYNTTGSQYTRIHPAYDGGYTLSGFTTINLNVAFRSNIFKLDSNLNSGCTDNDLTALTQVNTLVINKHNVIHAIANGAVITNASFETLFAATDTTLCEAYPNISAGYTAQDACIGNPIFFNAGDKSGVFYKWLFGNGDSIITPTSSASYIYYTPGTYTTTLIASNGCDADTQQLIIIIKGAPSLVITANENPSTQGQIVTLSSNIIAGNFNWSTGSSAPTTTVTNQGIYSLTVTVGGCDITDTIFIKFDSLANVGFVIIPSAFTPNKDGIHDDWHITANGQYRLKSMVVYNRQGNLVFKSDNINNTWQGENAQPTTEVYFYKVVFTKLGEDIIFKGDVTAIR
jgi:gliding motility-associated-like protein